MDPILRIVDANLNRLKEGLRVIEEWARFGLDNEELSKRLKNIRHKINSLSQLNDWTNEIRVNHRDTIGDVGTQISTKSEKTRSSILDLLSANFSRVQESLRVIEEYSKLKTSDHQSVYNFESIRYEIYTLEKEFISKIIKTTDDSLYLLLSSDLCYLDLNEFIIELLKSDIDMIQIREKKLSDREFYNLYKEIVPKLKEANKKVIINDRADIALALNADGVHLGNDELPYEIARKIMGDSAIIGLTVHNEHELEHANSLDLSYIGLGPCFQTNTKEELTPRGLDFISSALSLSKHPAYLIGGIDKDNIDRLLDLNAKHFAVCSCILSAPNPLLEIELLQEKILR